MCVHCTLKSRYPYSFSFMHWGHWYGSHDTPAVFLSSFVFLVAWFHYSLVLERCSCLLGSPHFSALSSHLRLLLSSHVIWVSTKASPSILNFTGGSTYEITIRAAWWRFHFKLFTTFEKEGSVWDSCAGNFDKKETVLSRIEIFLLWLLPLLSWYVAYLCRYVYFLRPIRRLCSVAKPSKALMHGWFCFDSSRFGSSQDFQAGYVRRGLWRCSALIFGVWTSF